MLPIRLCEVGLEVAGIGFYALHNSLIGDIDIELVIGTTCRLYTIYNLRC